MPFSSKAQERYMFAKHPGIAKRWSKITPNESSLPEHVKKASDALSFLKPRTIPGSLFKLAEEQMSEADIDQMLDPSWNQKDNPYNENQAGSIKYRIDGGPMSELSRKLKKDVSGGALVGAGAGVVANTARHIIHPEKFNGRKSFAKNIVLGTGLGALTGGLFAGVDEAKDRLHKHADGQQDPDNTRPMSLAQRIGKGALTEAGLGAVGAAIEAPVSKFVFHEHTPLTGRNMLSRMGAGAAIGALTGAAGGAMGLYGKTRAENKLEKEQDWVKNKTGNQYPMLKAANDVYNTSCDNGFGSGLADDKDPLPVASQNVMNVFSQKAGAMKETEPRVSDGDLADNDNLNRSSAQAPGAGTSV